MTLPVKTYRKRETIYRTGDSGGYLPKVLSGAVMLYTICDDGHRQIVDLAGTGDFLHFDVDGEIEHFAEALTESQIGFFPASALMGDPETAEYLVDQMRARIAIERRHITMMAKKSAHQRLADFLGLAAECLGTENGTLSLPLTRQQIADYTGLTLETVSRTFARWEREQRLVKLDATTYRWSEVMAA